MMIAPVARYFVPRIKRVRTRRGTAARKESYDYQFRRNRHRDRPGRALTVSQAGRGRTKGRGDRTEVVRRNMREYGLHSDKNAGGQRVRSVYGTACRGFRGRLRPGFRRHEESEGTEG